MLYFGACIVFVATFVVQVLLCRKAKRLWVKLIPAILIGAGEMACVVAYGVSVYLERTGESIYGAAFAAAIYGILLLILLAGDLTAWGVCAVVNYVQKRRK